MPKSPPLKKEKFFCNTCERETKHSLMNSHEKEGEDQVDNMFQISWKDYYQTFECDECETVCFRKKHWFSEAQFGEDAVYEYSYYPPKLSRVKPNWYSNLDEKFIEVLDEVYLALDVEARFLAAFGARTCLDMLMVDIVGDIGGFDKKLIKLQSDGYIDATELELLDAVTEAGNAAAHRGYAPDDKLLVTVMDILETLFHKIYIKPAEDKVLLTKARELKSKIPKRNANNKKSS